ncbi:hypothetical protein PHYPSEUDO_008920 [Phytophthora pseudosyringae]|uniref:Uncharacterized protein n=1 Tax=Phytophthora pseudosyringae TaxID=221518 RepID=A0A8T1VG87_9STRA|nr:hypothetical protein PHYPSEUDO_008920 [Phytophthora pseudosyringae]
MGVGGKLWVASREDYRMATPMIDVAGWEQQMRRPDGEAREELSIARSGGQRLRDMRFDWSSPEIAVAAVVRQGRYPWNGESGTCGGRDEGEQEIGAVW